MLIMTRLSKHSRMISVVKPDFEISIATFGGFVKLAMRSEIILV